MAKQKKAKEESKKVGKRRRKHHNSDSRYLSRMTREDRKFVKNIRTAIRIFDREVGKIKPFKMRLKKNG